MVLIPVQAAACGGHIHVHTGLSRVGNSGKRGRRETIGKRGERCLCRELSGGLGQVGMCRSAKAKLRRKREQGQVRACDMNKRDKKRKKRKS